MKAYKELYILLFSFEKHFPRLNSQLLNSSSSLTQVVDSEKPVLVNDIPCRKYSRLWAAGAAAVLSFWLISRADIDKSSELINNTVSTKSGFKTSVSMPPFNYYCKFDNDHHYLTKKMLYEKQTTYLKLLDK